MWGRAAQDASEARVLLVDHRSGGVQFSGAGTGGLVDRPCGVWLGGVAADDTGFRAAFLFTALLPWATWLWVRRTVELPPVQPDATAGQRNVAFAARTPDAPPLLVNWLLSSCWDVHTLWCRCWAMSVP